MEPTPQIFLSYARLDKQKVVELYQKLSTAGFNPWMDTQDILPGERWQSSIQKAIRRSDFFLACLSANSVSRRGMLQKEIKEALDIWQEKMEDDIYLIPVRLEDCEAPESLQEFQWVDLFEEGGWERLVKAIQVGMERQGKVIKLPTPRKDVEPERTNPKDDAVMIYIPEGEFLMGDNDLDNAKPQHRVSLDGYWIYKHPVTVAQYRKFCEATKRQMPSLPDWSKDDHPIINVSWNDAVAYCEWAGVRLPTEAEWEKAARGTDGRKFPWGEEWDGSKCANSVRQSLSSTKPVGSYPQGASPYGALDMAGNVWEWCSSLYEPYPYRADDGREEQGKNVAGDTSRVLRGGSWFDNHVDNFRCAYRTWYHPDSREALVGGFRGAAGADFR